MKTPEGYNNVPKSFKEPLEKLGFVSSEILFLQTILHFFSKEDIQSLIKINQKAEISPHLLESRYGLSLKLIYNAADRLSLRNVLETKASPTGRIGGRGVIYRLSPDFLIKILDRVNENGQ